MIDRRTPMRGWVKSSLSPRLRVQLPWAASSVIPFKTVSAVRTVVILQREIGRRLVHLQSAAGGWHTAREDKVTPAEKAKQREGQHAEHRAADFAAVAFRLVVRPL